MSEKKLLSIEIDGKKISALEGSKLIDVADQAGIPIPRFCYHEKLSVAASCRMCLVDIDKMAKPAPACATIISDGMVVRTRTDKVRAMQKSIMEFLLINHPLDCPICDQGGECELQDYSVAYGDQRSYYEEEKRTYPENNLGPLVETYMNRCIQCTRCVRYGEEIAGLRELGGLNRGDRLEISTYVEHALTSEISANIIDLCPVGALTAKPSKYRARPWEYKRHESISLQDGLGTNTYIHTVRGKIARVIPRENNEINQIWISDRDRFTYEANESKDRICHPMLCNTQGVLEKSDWVHALSAARMLLEGAIKKYGPNEVGFLVSPSATIEEMFLAKKLAVGLGIENIDSRFNQIDFKDDQSEPSFRSLGLPIKNVCQLDSIFLIGADPRMEVPLLGISIRNAVKAGAHVSMLNSYDADQLHAMNIAAVESPKLWVPVLAGVLKELIKLKGKSVPDLLQKVVKNAHTDERTKKIAQQLHEGQNQWIVLGADAISHPVFSTIRALSLAIAEVTAAAFGYISEGANLSGAYLTRCIPDTNAANALNITEMLTKKLKVYLLIGAIDPEFDFILSHAARSALASADAVIVLSPFTSEMINSVAAVLLPAAAWGETSGALVNVEGKCQMISEAVAPLYESRPLWKILRVLGNECNLPGFDYLTSEEVLREWFQSVKDIESSNNFSGYSQLSDWSDADTVPIIPVRSLYAANAYARRSTSLQGTYLAQRRSIMVHPDTYAQLSRQKLRLLENTNHVKTTDKMARDCVRYPREYALDISYYAPINQEGR